MRRFVLVILPILACRPSAAPPPADPEPATRVPAPEPASSQTAEASVPEGEEGIDRPFGGERWGFVMAATANRRFVFVRRFEGAPPQSMGHHGGGALDTELAVFDLERGTQRPLGEIIDVDDGYRFVLATGTKGETLLLDAQGGTWETIEASASTDGNRCLAPRTATFSQGSTHVGFVSDDDRAFIVRELATGETYTVQPGPGEVVWRGWPHEDAQRATLATVPEGSDPPWPQQRTSCACRYCNRFALSAGYYGWDGPSFDLVEVTPTDPPTTTDVVPERKNAWLDADARCKVEPTKTENRLEQGPWRWVCS